jgi:hypothetical protein
MNITLETLIPWLAGAIGVPVVNWLKTRLGWSGRAAVVLAAAVSVVLAGVALLATGEAISPAALLDNFGAVMAAATLIYKLITA